LVKAVIMAGGEGSRLRPLTVTRPKPMIPIVNKPIIVRLIEHVRDSMGVSEIGVTLHYLPNVIMSHLQDGSHLGVKLSYVVEEKPLGTAGGVRNLVSSLGWDDTLLVISGDVVTNIDLRKLIKFHQENKADFTMAVRRERDITRFGIVDLDEDGRVVRFKEKPSPGEVFSDVVNTGIYVIEPHVLKIPEEKKNLDFASDVIPRLLKGNSRVYGFRVDEFYWSDIGDLEQYRATHIDVLSGSLILPGGIEERLVKQGVYIGEDAVVDVEKINPPVVVGEGARVISSTIGPYAVIGRNVVVEENSTIENSIIFDNSFIGSSSVIEGAVVGENVRVGDHVVISEGSVIGDETRIGRGVHVKPRVRIWPSKLIDSYTTVASDLRWGVRWSRVLFEPWGMTGILNVDLTLEMLVKLGSAMGSVLREGDHLLAGCDATMAGCIGKQSIVLGALSAGVSVLDAGAIPLPLISYGVRRLKAKLGVYVNTIQGEYARVRVKVFDGEGKFVSKSMARRIEEVFFREQLRRSGEIESAFIADEEGLSKAYVSEITGMLASAELGARPAKVLVDCGGGVVANIISDVLYTIGETPYYSNCTEVKSPRRLKKVAFTKVFDSTVAIVKNSGFKLGLIFDNDGDKLVLATGRNGIVGGDRLIALMARIMLEEKPSGRILLPAATPRSILEYVEGIGGKVELADTGLMGLSEKLSDSYIMAADERGGVIYPFFHYGPDGVFTAVKILEFSKRFDIEKAVSEIPEVHKARYEVYIPFEKRGLFAKELSRVIDMREVETVDGFKIFEEDLGWAYLRFSRTEPVLEIIVEPIEDGKLELLAKTILELVERVKQKI